MDRRRHGARSGGRLAGSWRRGDCNPAIAAAARGHGFSFRRRGLHSERQSRGAERFGRLSLRDDGSVPRVGGGGGAAVGRGNRGLGRGPRGMGARAALAALALRAGWARGEAARAQPHRAHGERHRLCARRPHPRAGQLRARKAQPDGVRLDARRHRGGARGARGIQARRGAAVGERSEGWGGERGGGQLERVAQEVRARAGDCASLGPRRRQR
mmetsp:Transcript_28347/g.92577  ORF Transcript_28347/g.92577 Transcript_28347/m.92577 type:complete len:214 (+) Transcript_28347:202-843(+)